MPLDLLPIVPGGLSLTGSSRAFGAMIDVKNDYGALADARTDDSTQIQAAIDAAAARGGGIVFFPPGTYIVGAPLVLKDKVRLHGSGQTATTLQVKAGVDIDLLTTTGAARTNVAVCSMTLLGTNVAGAKGRGIHAALDRGLIFDCRLDLFKGRAVNLNDSTDAATNYAGYLTRILYCGITGGGDYGVFIDYPATDSWIVGCDIYGGNACLGVFGGPFRIFHNHLDGHVGNYCIYGSLSNETLLIGNLLESPAQSAIYLTYPSYYGDVQMWCQINDNFIRNTGVGYPAIYLAGFDATHRAQMIGLVGNMFQCPNANYLVSLAYAKDIAICGNGWGTWTGAAPVNLGSNVSNIELAGNTPNNSFNGNGGTQDRGSGASIPAGSNSVAVAHKLGVAPATVEISPTADTQGRRYWVSAKAAGTFTISLDANAAVNPITFDWSARV